jgi:hypothetical protein
MRRQLWENGRLILIEQLKGEFQGIVHLRE